jgi:extracellular elastinolytic metalloproteinase
MDAILIYVGDPKMEDNAQFVATPDGISPKLRLGLIIDSGTPRDSALDSTVLAHELFHGVSTRLVGGPENAHECLYDPESTVVSEGLSDIFAWWLTMKPPTAAFAEPGSHSPASHKYYRHDRVIGEFVSGNHQHGIRVFPVSTNMTTTPLTYKDMESILKGLKFSNDEVYRGAVLLSSIMYDVYWRMVDRDGFSGIWNQKLDREKGNHRFTYLLMDLLDVISCSTNLLHVRDSLLRVAINLKDYCDIWKSFARRGLGYSARPVQVGRNGYRYHVVDSFQVPGECNYSDILFQSFI